MYNRKVISSSSNTRGSQGSLKQNNASKNDLSISNIGDDKDFDEEILNFLQPISSQEVSKSSTKFFFGAF